MERENVHFDTSTIAMMVLFLLVVTRLFFFAFYFHTQILDPRIMSVFESQKGDRLSIIGSLVGLA